MKKSIFAALRLLWALSSKLLVKMVTPASSQGTSLCTNPRIHAEVMADEQSVALMTKAIMQQLD
jgi:hypothetical protein